MSATDLRYGRRGGGWIPEARSRETMHPHRVRLEPCPDRSCAGQLHIPIPRPALPFESECDGIWRHKWTHSNPTTSTTGGHPS